MYTDVVNVSITLQCTSTYSMYVINARRMRTRVTVLCLSVCLFVCHQSPGFYSRLYDKLDIPACSSLVNARRMRTRVTVLCLSVCLSVCLLPVSWFLFTFL